MRCYLIVLQFVCLVVVVCPSADFVFSYDFGMFWIDLNRMPSSDTLFSHMFPMVLRCFPMVLPGDGLI